MSEEASKKFSASKTMQERSDLIDLNPITKAVRNWPMGRISFVLFLVVLVISVCGDALTGLSLEKLTTSFFSAAGFALFVLAIWWVRIATRYDQAKERQDDRETIRRLTRPRDS